MNIDDGITCIECKTVLFDLYGLVNHLKEEPKHNYFKHGDREFVLYSELLETQKKVER